MGYYQQNIVINVAYPSFIAYTATRLKYQLKEITKLIDTNVLENM